MPLRTFPTSLATLLVTILFVHGTALLLGWYQSFPLIDIPLHLAGGFWVGAAGLWLYFYLKPNVSKTLFSLVASGILIAIVIGLLWEAFEFTTNLLLAKELFSLRDSAGDMVCDIIGGAFAGWYIVRKA